MTRHADIRRGATLVELLVALTILAGMAAIATLALRVQPGASAPTTGALVAEARRRAIETRRPVRVTLGDTGDTHDALALPDGRVIGARSDGIDPLTGLPLHASH